MIWIWLGIIIVLTLLELATKNLGTIWFIISATISFILSVFVDNYFIQFLVFVILGTLLLATAHDYLINFINNKKHTLKRGKNEK